MPYTLVRHKVRDYAKWKPVFDEHGSARRAKGSKGGLVFQNAKDPNEVLVLLEWDDLNKVREFVESKELRQAMERAGVSDKPDIFILNEVDKPEV